VQQTIHYANGDEGLYPLIQIVEAVVWLSHTPQAVTLVKKITQDGQSHNRQYIDKPPIINLPA
jgi:hypothetical protein